MTILQLAYEGLTRLDTTLKAVPAAAERWEFNAAGDVITFTLRANLHYHDGSPLTAENFRYAIERTCDPATAGVYQTVFYEIQGCAAFAATVITDTAAYAAAQAALTANLVVPDPRTLVLHFTHPVPHFPYIASLWVMYPVKQSMLAHAVEAWWEDPANHIGNGPFRITEIVPDQSIHFRVNERYWQGRPKLDGVELIYLQNPTAAYAAYTHGEVDIMGADPSVVPALMAGGTRRSDVVVAPSAGTVAWGFNLATEPFNDRKVREAFAYALDRDALCSGLLAGSCVAADSWIPPGIPGAIPDAPFRFDPAKARQALADSTYGGPAALPPVTLTYTVGNEINQTVTEWVAAQLQTVLDLPVTLDPLEATVLSARVRNPDTFPQACVFCVAWFQDYPDPQNWLSFIWRCDALSSKRRGYCNPELDRVTQQADSEMDPAKRLQLYEQANRILLHDLVAPPVFHPTTLFLVQPTVTGYTPTAADATWPGQSGSVMTIDRTR